MTKLEITLEDLGMAYRKAKVDLYYSSNAFVLMIADYEENLFENLKQLQDRINSTDDSWIKDSTFLGGWTLVPKGIDSHGDGKDNEDDLIHTSPQRQWEQICKKHKNGRKPVAEFRLMAKVSLDFHVLSALWIAKVGQKFDQKLSDSACGNRLRRKKNGDINPLSLGSFSPYLRPFRKWRDDGIATMRQALEDGKKIITITADVSSFYHELNPGFMLKGDFLEKIDLLLTAEENKLNEIFIQALKNWAASTPLGKGLPVGLPASAVVANMALFELDRQIKREVTPLYYGRYVDDIILVMENGSRFSSSKKVWEWLFARSNNLLQWNPSATDTVIFTPTYLEDSKIEFANKKNKVFAIEGESGNALIDSIVRQIHEGASEWQALPNLPQNPDHIATDFIVAAQNDGEAVDSLRKAGALTMRRAGFALKLRDFEAFERDLPADVWKKHRHAFLEAFIQHVMVLPTFFDLSVYLPRVLRIAVACEDFEILKKIIIALHNLQNSVRKKCDMRIKSLGGDHSLPQSESMSTWIDRAWISGTDIIIEESLKMAFPLQISRSGVRNWNELSGFFEFLRIDCSVEALKDEHLRLLTRDLAHTPFRYIALPRELSIRKLIRDKANVQYYQYANKTLNPVVVEGVEILSDWLNYKHTKELPFALLFATRPFSLTELIFIQPGLYEQEVLEGASKVVLALRGFSISNKLPWREEQGELYVPNGVSLNSISVAVTSWKTEEASWEASVIGRADPDVGRYQRLTRLINGLIAFPLQTHYLVMPELSLPAHWFIRIAQKLQSNGISLISGIEYLHRRTKIVSNQVWMALAHNGMGFQSMIVIRQDKQRPAPHEALYLHQLGEKMLIPEQAWDVPPVIQHGEFRFSILICSELTNIAHRSELRGDIDALFVPEWNKDIDTFNALVESAALDIHAFIIQCNDRQYGDSRIRAPYQKKWKRDMIRIKGGENDYFVIGEMDIASLRAFQSSHRSPARPFKPVPDGFQMSPERKTLPTSG